MQLKLTRDELIEKIKYQSNSPLIENYDLSYSDLSGLDLFGVTFHNCKLSYVNFSESKLTKPCFYHAICLILILLDRI